MENNDLFRFIQHHGAARTKMAAAFFFSLHGIPMMYNGQEVGFDTHPYNTSSIYLQNQSIQSQDLLGFFPYYQNLINIRKTYPALCSDNFMELSVTPGGYLFAYRRWMGSQNLFSIINLASNTTNANLTLPIDSISLDPMTTYYLTDLIDGAVISGTPAELAVVNWHMNPYQARIIILADTAVSVSIPMLADLPVPGTFELQQNFPNPFNPRTKILFTLPHSGEVTLTVYDILGRELSRLLNSYLNSGVHEFWFNGENLSSGIYVYRLEFAGRSLNRKMIMLK